MAFYEKTEFWVKVRESFSFFGTLGTGGMAGADAIGMATIPPRYMAYVAGFAIAGAVISHFTKIWFDDKDGDGNVDLFQKRVIR
jgi:hypothetical protein